MIQLDTDVCEELGFDVPRREAGVELDEATLIARERELGPAFVAEHGYRVAYAIAVNELECWLLPLVFDNNKAGKTTGCFEALHHRLKEREGRQPLPSECAATMRVAPGGGSMPNSDSRPRARNCG